MESNDQIGSLLKLIGNSTQETNFEKMKSTLRSYLANLVEALNKEAALLQCGLSFELPDENALSVLAGKIPSIEAFEERYEKIYQEQIASAFEVINSIVNEGLAHEHVTGLTQLGKSGLITVLMDFLGIISYHTIKKILLPIAWLPNAINMEKQSIEKLTQSSLLNGCIHVKTKQMTFPLWKFNEIVKAKMASLIGKKINEMAGKGEITVTDKTKLINEISEFFGPEGNRSALVLRRSTVSDQMYKWLFQAASETTNIEDLGEVNITLIMDESHIAIGKGQGGDRLLGMDTGASFASEMGNSDSNEENLEAPEADPDNQPDAEELQAREEEEENRKEVDEHNNIVSTYSQIFNNKAKLVTVSATNTPWNCINYKKGKTPIYLKVANGYCGFAFVDGIDYPLAEGVTVSEPIVKPMRELCNEIEDLRHLNLRHLDSAYSYARSLESEDWLAITGILNENMAILAIRLNDKLRKMLKTIGDDGRSRNLAAKLLQGVLNSKGRELMELAQKIRNTCQLAKLLENSEFNSLFTLSTEKDRKAKVKRLCGSERSLETAWKDSIAKAQNALAALLEYLLLTNNPQKKKGCILRWECNNETFNSFIKPLEAKLGNRILFVPYMGESASQTVSELLGKLNTENLPYVIVVTGRGRYGESYPPDCGYAIDGTTKNASSAAFFQSLLGRISGYNKYKKENPQDTLPMLILSDLAYDQVFMELKNGKGYSPKVGNGLNLTKTDLEFKPIETVCISRDPSDRELENLFKQLDSRLDGCKEIPLNQLSKSVKGNLFEIIETIASYAENHNEIVTKNLKGIHPDHPFTSIKFLRPGEAMDDNEKRKLDWHDRRDQETEAPAGAKPFVTFEFFDNGKKKFGLTSNRNNKRGAEYLHTGLQLEKHTYKVMAVWLWLKKPIISTVTGPMGGAVMPKVDSVPYRIDKGT